MLDEVPAKELEALEVPTEEYCGILLSLLKGLNGPSSDRLQLLLCHLKLVVLLQIQLTLDPKVGIQTLTFSFKVAASSIDSMRSFFSVEFSFSRASILDVKEATLAS